MASKEVSHKEVSVVAVGSQRGSERYVQRDRHDRPPVLNRYRSNLTALSQVHNLYLIACDNAIHIYQPVYPDQTLPHRPSLILELPASGTGLPFQFDMERGLRSINRVLVDFLGKEEILLTACDDGDVIGYNIQQIQHAVKELGGCSDEDMNKDIVSHYVRPFFHQNVQASAWGLAVHREARLIAVSANTHVVTIFSLALARASNLNLDEDEDTECHLQGSSAREQHIIHLLGAAGNVPAVSFNNTGTDPEGRWLLSCVIDGNVFIWNTKNPRDNPRVVRLAFCVNTRTDIPCSLYGFNHAAWNAVFLDSRAFRHMDSVEAALGSKPVRESDLFWNISHMRADNESRYAFHPQVYVDSENNDVVFQSLADQGESNNHGDASHEQDLVDPEAMDLEHDHGLDSVEDTLPTDASTAALTTMDTGNAPTTWSAVLDLLNLQDPAFAQGDVHDTSITDVDPQTEQNDEASDSEEDVGDDDAPAGVAVAVEGPYGQYWEDEGGIAHRVERYLPRGPVIKQLRSRYRNVLPPVPSCPIFITTPIDAFLLQPPASEDQEFEEPIIAFSDPCTRRGERVHHSLDSHDRMLFYAEIPELGVIITGTPRGRVAIFTLTHTRSRFGKPEVYGFRLDHVLPYAYQEDDGWKTNSELNIMVGIAVSPIQGMLGSEFETNGPRRWRLMMSFRDHGILSYEIGKFKTEEEMGVEALVL